MNDGTLTREVAPSDQSGRVTTGIPSQNLSAGVSSPGVYQGEPATPPTPQPRQIIIRPLNHGYVVTVGCQEFAIQKVSTLIRNLEKYLENPAQTEQKWLSGKLEL